MDSRRGDVHDENHQRLQQGIAAAGAWDDPPFLPEREVELVRGKRKSALISSDPQSSLHLLWGARRRHLNLAESALIALAIDPDRLAVAASRDMHAVGKVLG